MRKSRIAVAVIAASAATPALATNGIYQQIINNVNVYVDGRVTDQTDGINQRIDGLVQQGADAYSDHESRITGNATGVGENRYSINRNTQHISDTNSRLDGAIDRGEAAYNDLDSRATANAQGVATNTQGVAANAQGVATNTASNARQDGALAKHGQRMDISEAQVADFQARSNAAFAQHASAITGNRAAIVGIQGDVNHLQQDVGDLKAGVAAAVAAASHQFDLSTGAGGQVSVAGGYYEGENAASLALGAPVGDNAFLNVNASHDSRGNAAYGVGASFKVW